VQIRTSGTGADPRRPPPRQHPARTDLRPAPKRPNLQPVTNALVHRVLFDGKRATGVEFSLGGGTVERAEAAREVILSAGAIGSPHILQLSGVGDPDHLGHIGVPVVHELHGGFSPPRRCSNSSAKRPCPAAMSRPTTSCSTTRGATAASAVTPAALA
jgi:hypothetical protein